MNFRNSAAFATAMADNHPSIAVVTGGRSGIGLAIAIKIASFPFIEQVLAVSRSISPQHVQSYSPKLTSLAADLSTTEGRTKIVQEVDRLCGGVGGNNRKKQLRFLIQSAGSIDPIKPVLEVQPDELRRAMVLNCEAPLFLTTALYPYMKPLNNQGVPGRVLHVSSGAAHGAPPVGWSCYGISKAAFYQSYKVLEREFRQAGGFVVVGSFKPGVVDTDLQGTIRESSESSMPIVQFFRNMKSNNANNDNTSIQQGTVISSKARPPPKGALDTSENVAFFVEYLLLGMTDEEFANANDNNEHSIQDASLFEKWVDPK